MLALGLVQIALVVMRIKRAKGKRGPVRSKKVTYDGITFASGLEKYMYTALKKAKIKKKLKKKLIQNHQLQRKTQQLRLLVLELSQPMVQLIKLLKLIKIPQVLINPKPEKLKKIKLQQKNKKF